MLTRFHCISLSTCVLQKEQAALRKMEEAAALEEKRRRQQETRDMLDLSLRMKMRKRAKEEQEQLAFDLKMLEQLLEESKNETREILQRKVRAHSFHCFNVCSQTKVILDMENNLKKTRTNKQTKACTHTLTRHPTPFWTHRVHTFQRLQTSARHCWHALHHWQEVFLAHSIRDPYLE